MVNIRAPDQGVMFHAKKHPNAQSILEIDRFFMNLYKMVIWLIGMVGKN